MKPKASLRFLLCSATFAMLAAPSSQAVTYYWDNNGDTAGFGTAVGHDALELAAGKTLLTLSGASTLTITSAGGSAADVDSNNDGVLNRVAYVNANAIGLLPDFDYTTIKVEYGSDLTGWTPAVHDGDDVIITVDDQSPNDEVTVKLKRSTLSSGGKLFARLNVVVTP